MFFKIFMKGFTTIILILSSFFIVFSGCSKNTEMKEINLPPTSVLKVQSSWAVITAPHLRLREEPSVSSRVIRYLRKGFVLEVIQKTTKMEIIEGETNYWYRVNFDGLNGWVYGSYLMMFDSKEKAEAASRNINK